MEMKLEHPNRESIGGNSASIILYTILSFILGLLYFIIVVVGLSVGIGTSVIGLGLLILLITIGVINGIATIERSIVYGLLGVAIPSPRPNTDEHVSLWKRSAASLRDPLTWKSLLYIFLKLPLSICSFGIMVSFVATSVALLLAPVGYLITTYVLMRNGIHLTPDQYVIAGIHVGVNNPLNVVITGAYDSVMFVRSFAWTIIGIFFSILTRYVLRGLGWIAAELARVMLGPIPIFAENYQSEVLYTRQHRPE